ncbi:MAG TPA: HK97-gp10 family putative phage morphogenesis protein [Gammaproteobacteria bacterium]|nr:HK97-gp10 family putative phage morphogenesis protein [Gammaproteobacteria bacterium]
MKITFGFNPSIKKFESMFSALPAEIKTGIKTALVKASFLVEGESKKITPVDTGRLRSSIFTTIYDKYATVEPKTNYAIFVHEGTKRMKGRPFMTNALDTSKEKITKIFGDEIENSLKKVLK